MYGLFKLVGRYAFGGESIFFIIFFPIILFGIMGEATIFTSSAPDPQRAEILPRMATSFTSGIAITQIIATGLFLIPITIVDFKNSVLMKRIGATNIRPWQFLFIVLILFLIQSTFSFFYVRGVATLLYGWRHDMNWTFAFPPELGIGFLWSLFAMAVTICCALAIASISKTVRQASTIANLIYFPIAILSGGFVPIDLVYKSAFLKDLNYINPFKYVLEPYFASQGAFKGTDYVLHNTEYIIFPLVSVALILLLSLFVSKKLKWTT